MVFVNRRICDKISYFYILGETTDQEEKPDLFGEFVKKRRGGRFYMVDLKSDI